MVEFARFYGVPFAACVAQVLILSYVGMHVLKREVIFVDISLAQFAAVGALVAHVVFGVHGDSAWGYAAAFGATFAAAAFYAFARRGAGRIGIEAVIGITYAIAAAGALFIVGVAPGGHIHVQQMLAGSVLLTTTGDVVRSAAGFAVAGTVFFLCRRQLRAISEDYAGAAGAGLKAHRWDFVFYALTGVVITLAVGIGGVVLVFAFLIIPATVSAVFSSRWGVRLVIAWCVGVGSSVSGILFAARLDFSVGPSIALALGAAVAAAGLWALVRGG